MTTITAAIYARKSTDDSDRNAENKSVTRQIERCKAYAKRNGWTVRDEHVYVDDGISGADFENRPGFTRLLAAVPKRQKAPPFTVLIMSEPSRLGRDQQRVPYYLAHLHDAGVRIFYYLDDREEKLDTPMDRLMASVTAFKDEDGRKIAGQRSFDALTRKAAKGFNAGGVVYGYDNVPVFVGDVKSHTDYRINDAQADVIRRICRAFVDGHGHVAIAKAMNGDPKYAEASRRYFDGARPASPRKGTGSWAPSSVHKILRNERYRGVVEYGAYRKTYKHGEPVRVRRPAAEVQRIERPDLRIIPGDLWREVRERLAAVKKTYVKDTKGKLWGRPGTGVESKYLLTGLGECACCAHNITKLGGRVGSPGKRAVRHYYGCAYHATRGRTICTNDYLAPMEEADALVIAQVRGVLTPAAADYAIDRALELIGQKRSERVDVPDRLDAEARRLRKELDRFVKAIGDGTAPASVLTEIRRREARLVEVEEERKAWAVEVPTELEERRLRRTFRERLAAFDGLLRADVPLARQALRKVIAGRIEFHPAEQDGARGYRLRFALVTSALLGGNIEVASPRGLVRVISPIPREAWLRAA